MSSVPDTDSKDGSRNDDLRVVSRIFKIVKPDFPAVFILGKLASYIIQATGCNRKRSTYMIDFIALQRDRDLLK